MNKRPSTPFSTAYMKKRNRKFGFAGGIATVFTPFGWVRYLPFKTGKLLGTVEGTRVSNLQCQATCI
jgi:hypothetical protein